MPSFLSHVGRSGRLLIAGTVLTIVVAGPVAAQTTATSFSGEAQGVVANVTLADQVVDVTLVEAGPLPPAGGFFEDQLANAEIPNVLTADAISASTEGAGDTAESNAEILGLDLSILGLLDVTSSTLSSNAVATCGPDGATVSGSSIVEDLVINGDEIIVDGAPNQTVNLPGGITIVINEQVSNVAADGSSGEITVNALRITIDDPLNPGTLLADVVLARSHADVTCLPDSSTDGAIEAMQTSTGGPAGTILLALLLLGGLAVSMLLLRPLFRR